MLTTSVMNSSSSVAGVARLRSELGQLVLDHAHLHARRGQVFPGAAISEVVDGHLSPAMGRPSIRSKYMARSVCSVSAAGLRGELGLFATATLTALRNLSTASSVGWNEVEVI